MVMLNTFLVILLCIGHFGIVWCDGCSWFTPATSLLHSFSDNDSGCRRRRFTFLTPVSAAPRNVYSSKELPPVEPRQQSQSNGGRSRGGGRYGPPTAERKTALGKWIQQQALEKKKEQERKKNEEALVRREEAVLASTVKGKEKKAVVGKPNSIKSTSSSTTTVSQPVKPPSQKPFSFLFGKKDEILPPPVPVQPVKSGFLSGIPFFSSSSSSAVKTEKPINTPKSAAPEVNKAKPSPTPSPIKAVVATKPSESSSKNSQSRSWFSLFKRAPAVPPTPPHPLVIQAKKLKLERYLPPKTTKFLYSTLRSVPTDKKSLNESVIEFKSCMKQIGNSRNHYDFLDNCIDVAMRHKVATFFTFVGIEVAILTFLPTSQR